MKIKNLTEVYDKKSPFFYIVIDSAKEWSTDAFIFEGMRTSRVSEMIVDRIAFFEEPEFLVQWSDCKEDYTCEKAASNVFVIFAHDEGETPVNTKLKMETIEDLHGYCKALNDEHQVSYMTRAGFMF